VYDWQHVKSNQGNFNPLEGLAEVVSEYGAIGIFDLAPILIP